MVSLLKNIFGKRELTDAELYSAYNKSPKSVKDFDIYIMSIKEGKEAIALKEICGINLTNINDIDLLIEILEQNNINKGISLSTNRDKKKLNSIYNQLKEINIIRKKFLPNDERLIHFIYSNKYDLFSYLRKNCENNKDFLNYIYNTYLTKKNYITMLEYFLLKDFENDIKFLFPNENNYIYLQKNNAITNYINLSDVFYNLNKENEAKNQINNLLLNIIIYFYTNHKDEILLKNLNKYNPTKNVEYIEIILSLYSLSLKLDKSITLKDFLKNKLETSFKKISMAEYSTFCYVLNNIISNVKEYSNIYKGLKFLPLEILRNMIIDKAKYDLLIKAIDIIINSNQYNNLSVFNFILKYMFDYYCFNKVSLSLLNKILKYLIKYNPSFNKITKQLDSLLDVVEILERYNIKFVLNELINNDDINEINKDNIYIKLVIEYLDKIIENNIENNDNEIFSNLSEKNIIDIDTLLKYKQDLTFGKLLIYYFQSKPDKRPIILHIISSNKEYLLSNKELKSLIDLYLLDPYLIKPEECDFIEQYLDSQTSMISGDIYVKLENLLEYLRIKEYISKYNISDSFFKNYTLDNYSENIPKILNTLLIKATKIDEIDNIKIFLNSQQSEDIKKALNLKQGNYLLDLFNFLMEYDRKELALQIIQILIEKKETKYFNKCLDYVYNNIYKKNKAEFKKYCKEAKIEEYILENNNMYIDILLDDINQKKDEKINFPLDRQPNDILLFYSLIKQKKIKKEKNKPISDLFLSFEDYEKNNKDKKNLKNLIECYQKNKDESDLNDDRINYNYSLHPKLIEILKNKNYFHLFQDLNITFKTKLQIYNFCLNNKVCTLNDIMNTFEIIKLKKKTKNDKDIVEKFKMFFNLYKEKDEVNNDIYKNLLDFIKQNYDSEQNEKNAILLIDFNLSNKINISYNNLIFLNVFFGYKISSSNEKELKLLKLLSKSSNKINILPFCADFNDNYLSNKSFQEVMDKYYKNNIIISLKENNKYFELIKGENIYSHPNIYYQNLELFKILNISNIFTIRDILSHLDENKEKRVNINLIFILNILINFFSIGAIIPTKIDYGLNNIIGILNTIDLSLIDINIILEEIFFCQSISYINNSCHNILKYNKDPEILLYCFMKSKRKLVEELIRIYYGNKISNNLLMNYYKIFLVKSEIIKEIKDDDEEDTIKKYNAIKSLTDFKEIIDEIKSNDILKEKVYEIYNN